MGCCNSTLHHTATLCTSFHFQWFIFAQSYLRLIAFFLWFFPKLLCAIHVFNSGRHLRMENSKEYQQWHIFSFIFWFWGGMERTCFLYLYHFFDFLLIFNEMNRIWLWDFKKSESFVVLNQFGPIYLGKNQDSVYEIFR